MRGFAKQKVVGGKLLEVRVDYDKVISNVYILGDFFIYPEESLDIVEKSVISLDADETEENIAEIIGDVVMKNNIEMVGITPEAIASTIKMAMKNGVENNKD